MFSNSKQVDKLADMCFDIAKALFVASFTVPLIASTVELVALIRYFVIAILLTYVGMNLLRERHS